MNALLYKAGKLPSDCSSKTGGRERESVLALSEVRQPALGAIRSITIDFSGAVYLGWFSMHASTSRRHYSLLC